MRFIVFLLLANFLGNPVHALTCFERNPKDAFRELNKSKELYLPLVGQLKYLDPLPDPSTIDPVQSPSNSVKVKFSGNWLTGQKIQDFELDYFLECWGSWCGGYLSEDEDYILFVRKQGTDDFSISSTPCPENTIWPNDNSTRKIFKRCLAGSC